MFKVGQRVYSFSKQEWGVVDYINKDVVYQLGVLFGTNYEEYTIDGKRYEYEVDEVPDLYRTEVKAPNGARFDRPKYPEYGDIIHVSDPYLKDITSDTTVIFKEFSKNGMVDIDGLEWSIWKWSIDDEWKLPPNVKEN